MLKIYHRTAKFALALWIVQKPCKSRNKFYIFEQILRVMTKSSYNNKVIIFCAPSGSGKSTIVKHLLQKFPFLEFSISATSRKPRGEEEHGRHYYFMSQEEFENHIRNNDFVEYEEVYSGYYYGTLKSEVERIWAKGHVIVFDIDVKGGINIKRLYDKNALSVFVQPPSIEELRKRLIGRGTDSTADIERRVAKAEEELSYRDRFDTVLINDDLETAFHDAEELVIKFLQD